ncbi:dynactin p62 [Piedraia hortae CBS 480.64]|uniref:Dynactin subunit 4 n=1 Tax=Piedraia hortae CBS 480.64 TaxID=1314780 RepID=A0A6A7BZW5_9PEZI|nr:dynactin p62 [Piedraia hortae CBS 480.64]
MAFPYTHYTCPCGDEEGEEARFSPHGLYPLETLLFCDECDAIRCPRCWAEEVLCWYCPTCLFEVPSPSIKGEGNRCPRSCYNCPICAVSLVVTTLPPKHDTGLLKPSATPEEAYTLQCQCCDWSSVDVGIKLNKPARITEQLSKQRYAKRTKASEENRRDVDQTFDCLAKFYHKQLSETEPISAYTDSPYGSPAALAKLLNFYGGVTLPGFKKKKVGQGIREAREPAEGFWAIGKDDEALLDNIRALNWDDKTTAEQRDSAPVNHNARLIEDLWPTAQQLRTRKGKRCKTCRQYLAKPDVKKLGTKYKVRLLAQSHIPRLTMRPLHGSDGQIGGPFRLRPTEPTPPELSPGQTKSYILTIHNPIFETIKVTLGTPSITPGPISSRVTILCPSFTVGPAGDAWEEALHSSAGPWIAEDGRKRAQPSISSISLTSTGEKQPEAGKVWDRKRNATSVIAEIVVPLALTGGGKATGLLEVPFYVRAEWDETETKDKEKEKCKREVAFWCLVVLGQVG